jgi:hypothetical protein
LPAGKILAVAGSDYHDSSLNGPFRAQITDPDTGKAASYTLSEDIFCCHHNRLANRNVLFTGDMLKYDVQNPEGRFLGLKSAYEFDVQTNTFQKVSSMARGGGTLQMCSCRMARCGCTTVSTSTGIGTPSPRSTTLQRSRSR